MSSAAPHALLLTDIVDSTQLTEQLDESAAAALWARHDRLAPDLIPKWRGREVDKTDGMLILFCSVRDAVGYALKYQRTLHERALGIEARAGIHYGRISLRANPPEDVARGAKPIEVDGLALPMTARVSSLARGGQILLTGAAREGLGGELPGSATMVAHGHYRLKGIAEPVELFEIGIGQSAPFTPPSDAEKGLRVVRTEYGWQPVRDVRHNLPPERDGFVGRAASLLMVASHLDAGARLLTILGTAGIGKTRLVRRYAWNWLGDWPGGVYFCDLSDARSLDGILFVLAVAMEVPLGQGDPTTQLAHAMATRGRCLIVLDNFEQVVGHAHATVGRWLDAAPNAAFLVTSRERLRIAGEQVLPLEPLSIDDEGVELFTLRARAQRPDFRIVPANEASVRRIVALLDGLPLAIELAAARIRVMSPAQLVERLRDRFALLASAPNQADRQATLRNAIDWSWDLLHPWERAALAQCSVFEGGFTLAAAEAVLDLSAWTDAPAIIDVIQVLVDKSWLRTWVPVEQLRHDFEEPYFGMYLSLHEYAAEKLVASGMDTERIVEKRHGEYFARFGSDDSLRQLYRHGGVARRRLLALDIDNLLIACRRAVRRGHGGIAVAVLRVAWEALMTRGPFDVVRALGAEVDALCGLDASLRAAGLMATSRAAIAAGDLKDASALLARALEFARSANDRNREAEVLVGLAQVKREQGKNDEARADAQKALALRDTMATVDGVALAELAMVQHSTGAIEDARATYEGALAIDRKVGDQLSEVRALIGLAALHAEQNHRDQARALFAEALALSREFADRRQEARILYRDAFLDFGDALHAAARQKCEASLAIYRDSGERAEEAKVRFILASLELQRGRLNEAQAEAEAALTIAREVGLGWVEANAPLLLAGIAYERRDFDEASRRYEEGLAANRAMGALRGIGFTLAALAKLRLQQGHLEQAQTLIAESETQIRAIDDRYNLVEVLCIKGHLAIVMEEIEVARACLAEALSKRAHAEKNLNAVALLCLQGEVDLADGEVERAQASLDDALRQAAAMGVDSHRIEQVAELRQAIERARHA